MNARQEKIIAFIAKEKKVGVVELSKAMEVSQVTIRKDLMQLEEEGLIQREHGYALINDSDDINKRMVYNFDSKQRIARYAAELVKDGETILVESGSCCVLFAKEVLSLRKDVTIITNSAFLADYVHKLPNGRIILLGGEYQKESEAMVGPMVKACVEIFNVDKLFIGADGFHKDSGFTGNDYLRAQAVRDMAKQASNVYVLTNSYKFSKRGMVNLLENDKIHAVITDVAIDEQSEEELKELGILVHKV